MAADLARERKIDQAFASLPWKGRREEYTPPNAPAIAHLFDRDESGSLTKCYCRAMFVYEEKAWKDADIGKFYSRCEQCSEYAVATFQVKIPVGWTPMRSRVRMDTAVDQEVSDSLLKRTGGTLLEDTGDWRIASFPDSRKAAMFVCSYAGRGTYLGGPQFKVRYRIGLDLNRSSNAKKVQRILAARARRAGNTAKEDEAIRAGHVARRNERDIDEDGDELRALALS